MKPEIASGFRKSSYSGQEGDCVEVARAAGPGRVVRDSKNPAGPRLAFGAGAWGAFLETLTADESAVA